MLPVIRQSFIIVLAILQLFAPLVHAHTGDINFSQGLHVPGLELYLINQDASVGQNVKADWDSEGLLVVVDAGIKNPQYKFVESTDHSFAVLPTDQFQMSAFSENDSNFSPHLRSFSFRRPTTTHSPRAPPVQ